MIDDLGGVTTQMVRLALDVAMQRHSVISNNIANANTEGFRPQALDFEKHLRQQLEQQGIAWETVSNNGTLQQALVQAQTDLQSGAYVQGSGATKVELDQEMLKMSENVLRYQALLNAMEKRGAIMHMAITGSRE
jgi:flagellar basal-body rod protein FlgB